MSIFLSIMTKRKKFSWKNENSIKICNDCQNEMINSCICSLVDNLISCWLDLDKTNRIWKTELELSGDDHLKFKPDFPDENSVEKKRKWRREKREKSVISVIKAWPWSLMESVQSWIQFFLFCYKRNNL